ncbi:AraC family transcriptional regulator [Streptomyces abyssalis]|uniref:AraC family transcriptional regulator n=1 Tax=Streptomyces abyssalis TaxID=933944 RepID=UPI000AB24EA8|nr:AraC family transcriptional regulator [Streptomyces abyssalis]
MTVDTERRRPVERFEFSTSDPAVAASVTKDAYCDCRQWAAPADDFTFRFCRTSAGGVSLDHLVHSNDTIADCDVIDGLMFVFLAGGSFSVTSGDQEATLSVGGTALYPPGVPIRLSWNRLRAEFLRVPADAAERAAADHGAGGGVRFLGTLPVSAQMDRFWRSTVGFVSHQLEMPDSPLSSPLVRDEMVNLLGAAAVRTFPNTTMTADYRPGPGQASPAAVRRAADFVEAHADRPLTTADIAAAASTSPSALQAAFERQYGTTPLGYLRRVRLEHAHRELQATDPTGGATVAGIATRWGFPEAGAFAAHYHDVYGQQPGHTLRT